MIEVTKFHQNSFILVVFSFGGTGIELTCAQLQPFALVIFFQVGSLCLPGLALDSNTPTCVSA
jgi:hypothetical protein